MTACDLRTLVGGTVHVGTEDFAHPAEHSKAHAAAEGKRKESSSATDSRGFSRIKSKASTTSDYSRTRLPWMTAAITTSCSCKLINDAIAVNDQFAKAFVVELRHFSTGPWKLCQHPGPAHNFLDDDASEGERVSGNIFSDGLEIAKSALGLTYSVSHLLRRASTSSWDRVPLARASSKPRRTLPRT